MRYKEHQGNTDREHVRGSVSSVKMCVSTKDYHRTIRKNDLLYCGIVQFSAIAIAHLGALASIAPWYCMSPAFLWVFFCSAVMQVVRNTRGPEKFHAQIFSSWKLCKKAPTTIKKTFKYFRKIVVVFSFFS